MATPGWLTEDHKAAIRATYKAARSAWLNTGVKHHVDHIVPLQGENVSGLHVPWNLQVITAHQNWKKYNNMTEVV